MDRETAVEFANRIERAFAHLDQSLQFLRTRLDEDDLLAFADLWRPVVSELDLGVLEVIYRAHPDLRPQDMPPVPPLAEDEGR
jgi:hypothetical protein